VHRGLAGRYGELCPPSGGGVGLGMHLYRGLLRYLSAARYRRNFNWSRRTRAANYRAKFVPAARGAGRAPARDPLSLSRPPRPGVAVRASHVFSSRLHPPRKCHCSNIQNGDVHCGAAEWATMWFLCCRRARAATYNSSVILFKSAVTPKIEPAFPSGESPPPLGIRANRCAV